MANQSRDVLFYAFEHSECDWQKTFFFIQELKLKSIDPKVIEDYCKLNNRLYITIFDQIYPAYVRKTGSYIPFVLYYEGDISLLSEIKDDYSPFIFLYGENVFGIPSDRVVRFDNEGKLDFGGKLKIWENFKVDRLRLPSLFCSSCICTNRYSIEKGKEIKFNLISIRFAGVMKKIFVRPTEAPSWNNNFIKEGAILIDDLSVLKEEGIL